MNSQVQMIQDYDLSLKLTGSVWFREHNDKYFTILKTGRSLWVSSHEKRLEFSDLLEDCPRMAQITDTSKAFCSREGQKGVTGPGQIIWPKSKSESL